jgi:hypothetical protein
VYGLYSEKRDLDPSHALSMMAYEAEALTRGGVFASRPSCYRLGQWSAIEKRRFKLDRITGSVIASEAKQFRAKERLPAPLWIASLRSR